MASEAQINEKCIVGLPTCGYAFNSARMAFIAAPADDDYQLELDILSTLLEEKGYDAYLALRNVDPGKFAFCTKICSKIIQAQFCIVRLNSSAHRDHSDIQIPNPNVHMEYGLMLGFRKYIVPMQRRRNSLAFNVQPLDTILYTNAEFKRVANDAIDSAILAAGTTARPGRALSSSESLIRYLGVRGLRVTQLNTDEARQVFGLGEFLGFNLLDGPEIIYFGFFDTLDAKEIVFRLKLLIQRIDQAISDFEEVTSKTLPPERLRQAEELRNRLRIEVLIDADLPKVAIESRVRELTAGFRQIPWKIITASDIEESVAQAYADIGEL